MRRRSGFFGIAQQRPRFGFGFDHLGAPKKAPAFAARLRPARQREEVRAETFGRRAPFGIALGQQHRRRRLDKSGEPALPRPPCQKLGTPVLAHRQSAREPKRGSWGKSVAVRDETSGRRYFNKNKSINK